MQRDGTGFNITWGDLMEMPMSELTQIVPIVNDKLENYAKQVKAASKGKR